MRPEEVDAVARAFDGDVLGTRTLAGGFSHETSLVTFADGFSVVARIGGGDHAVEAAVMAAAARHVPVPRVLRTLPETGDARAVMVLEHVDGRPLSTVTDGTHELGADVGRVLAAIGRIAFDRPGFFADATLAVGTEPPWSEQLPGFVAACMEKVPGDRLPAAARTEWVRLCTTHAPRLAAVDGHARLVHSDANPKNLIVDADATRVVSVLDWEFAYSGSPYADAANMLRFGAALTPAFRDGFTAAFAEHQPTDLPLVAEWRYLGRLLDMFALSELVTRPDDNPIADQAADVVRQWLADGIPDTGQKR